MKNIQIKVIVAEKLGLTFYNCSTDIHRLNYELYVMLDDLFIYYVALKWRVHSNICKII